MAELEEFEYDLVISILENFELRFRDSKKPGRCLSIEHEYVCGYVDGPVLKRYDFSEDALLVVMRAWGCLGRRCPFWQFVVATVFGIGAKSEREKNARIHKLHAIYGEKMAHQVQDLGMAALLEEIKILAGDRYGKLFLQEGLTC